jgi:hypothetical protein
MSFRVGPRRRSPSGYDSAKSTSATARLPVGNHRHEGDLRDDATAVLVEWRRGNRRTVVPETV